MRPAHRVPLLALALLSAPACAGGGDGDEGSLSQGSMTIPVETSGTGTGTGGGTAITEATGEPTTSPSETGSSSGAAESTGTTEPVQPPIECGTLTQCGVQCVDLQTDPGNCGKCGISCVIPHATAACGAGTCAIGSCDPGWNDCDQDLQTGCEKTLGPGEQCAPVCKEANPESCNLFDDNCNGTCDEGGIAGCRQPVHRASSPTLGHFYTIDQAEASSGDFTPEFLNYFYMHVAPLPGLVPLYRCLKGDGRRFYTTSDTCEGAGPVEGILGHIGTEAFCGGIPLYRLYGNADHFYTTSAEERDNAVAMYGYLFEAQVGFVWAGP